MLYFEVLNALKYSNLFNYDELNDAGESLENYGFIVIPLKNEVRKNSIEIAINHDLSIYDASYIGLSLVLDCFFYTADQKIIKKLPNNLKKRVKSLDQIES
ncbi:MAG: type II toxin-antitoxin system VapC family toxin [Promethearchaeota archaeon]